LRRACLDAAQEALGLLAEAGAHVEAIALAHRALVIDPLHEPTWIGLMRAHADAGQPREALRAFAELEAMLRRDLGAPPSEAAARLARRIEAQVGAAAAAAAVAATAVASTAVRAPRNQATQRGGD